MPAILIDTTRPRVKETMSKAKEPKAEGLTVLVDPPEANLE
jgi:hypothetical protein